MTGRMVSFRPKFTTFFYTVRREQSHFEKVLICFTVGHETECWSVYRRYLEFYVLESKLTEFHGKVVCCLSLHDRDFMFMDYLYL